ncbi:hypothetical protein ACA910_002212 [Epithemia clementina (nom. ined.)]
MRNYQNHRSEENTTATELAVNHDKADVPTQLWDQRVAYLLGITFRNPLHLKAFDLMRRAMLRQWRRNVIRSWKIWKDAAQAALQQKDARELKVICERGLLACVHACDATLWQWDRGSAIFFWRWPEENVTDEALGVRPLWIGRPPTTIEKQTALGDVAMIEQMKTKLDDVCLKGYIAPGECRATMHFFAVPKGDTDVRMVYDGTKSKLNDCLYAPWFPLPDADILARTLDVGYWCIDNNYGEMFLNFWLHPELELYSGMELSTLYGTLDSGQVRVEVWKRCPMGQSPSLFATVQQMRCLKRLILGNRKDPDNVFRWEHVNTDLPGSETYKPGAPWITKRRDTGEIAADAHNYVDNLRGTAHTAEEAWQVGSRYAKIASFYGVQDAARKCWE